MLCHVMHGFTGQGQICNVMCDMTQCHDVPHCAASNAKMCHTAMWHAVLRHGLSCFVMSCWPDMPCPGVPHVLCYALASCIMLCHLRDVFHLSSCMPGTTSSSGPSASAAARASSRKSSAFLQGTLLASCCSLCFSDVSLYVHAMLGIHCHIVPCFVAVH